MAGRIQKAYDDLEDQTPGATAHRTEPTVIDTDDLDADAVATVPDPPMGLNDYGLAWWSAYWRSRSAVYVDPSGPAMRPLVQYAQAVGQRQALWEEVAKRATIQTDNGNLVRHPNWSIIRQLDQMMMRYEDQFGLTPLSQMRLGIDFLSGRTLEENLKARGVTDLVPRGPQPK